MIDRQAAARYTVRLSVPRIGDWRAWGAVSGEFERRLAGQASRAVTGARLESESRRGRDYVRVTVLVTVEAADVAQAMAAVWRVFRKAAGDDIAGWDTPAAAAEIRPTEPLTHRVPHVVMRPPARPPRSRAVSRRPPPLVSVIADEGTVRSSAQDAGHATRGA
jgi:hypothetical protein